MPKPCLQEMERCGLCIDEKQGGTASILSPLSFQGRFYFSRRKEFYVRKVQG